MCQEPIRSVPHVTQLYAFYIVNRTCRRPQNPYLQEAPTSRLTRNQTSRSFQNPDLHEATESRVTGGFKIKSYTKLQTSDLHEAPKSRLIGDPPKSYLQEAPNNMFTAGTAKISAADARSTLREHTRIQIDTWAFGRAHEHGQGLKRHFRGSHKTHRCVQVTETILHHFVGSLFKKHAYACWTPSPPRILTLWEILSGQEASERKLFCTTGRLSRRRVSGARLNIKIRGSGGNLKGSQRCRVGLRRQVVQNCFRHLSCVDVA